MNPTLRSIEALSPFSSPERLEKMRKVLSQRTRYLSVVLEDIYQPHNASAVLRTCDALGIQDVHIVSKRNAYRVNPEIALGSAQWLSLKTHDGESARISTVLGDLKKQGYRIVVTSPHAKACPLYDFDVARGPCALVFGTELNGVSQEVSENADEFLSIPMYGFVESFNISVSAAICLSHLSQKVRTSDRNWRLDQDEQEALLLEWLRKGIKASEEILRRLGPAEV